MLAHASLAGVGIGILFKISPQITSILAAVLSTLLLFLFWRQKRFAPEAASMLILTGGLALALLFAHMAKNNPISFESYLFGSILTITPLEMATILLMNLGILAILLLAWNRLRAVVLDPNFARCRFPHHSLAELLFMMLIGIMIAVSLKVIGGLLIGALLVIPVLCARNLSRSFFASVIWSVLFNISGVILGIIASYYFDVPTSSSIVLALITLFLFSTAATRLFTAFAQK